MNQDFAVIHQRRSSHIHVIGEAGVFHDDAVPLAGVFAEQFGGRLGRIQGAVARGPKSACDFDGCRVFDGSKSAR